LRVLPRFYAPDAGESGVASLIALPDAEAEHLARVLRLKPGDAVRVFDGTGKEWRGKVADVSRQGASIELIEAATPAPEPRIAIALALAVLKGDKMDDVVRDAVMLGAAAIHPLFTDRTEMSPNMVARGGRVPRWQRIAISSAKQCGRAVVPAVHPARRFDDWLGETPVGTRLMLVEPGVLTAVRDVREVPQPEAAELIVGPEGGWSENEVKLAASTSVQRVTLGTLTLRADAVPIVALSAIRTLWGDL
jgi:16S rRNA (uracil1498-N3)-methyltransferase